MTKKNLFLYCKELGCNFSRKLLGSLEWTCIARCEKTTCVLVWQQTIITERPALTQHSPACSKVCGPAESRSSWARPRTPRTARTPHARGSQWLWAGICPWSAGGIRHTLPSDPYLQWWKNPLIGTFFQSACRARIWLNKAWRKGRKNTTLALYNPRKVF